MPTRPTRDELRRGAELHEEQRAFHEQAAALRRRLAGARTPADRELIVRTASAAPLALRALAVLVPFLEALDSYDASETPEGPAVLEALRCGAEALRIAEVPRHDF